ncbi:MAG: hypothetical protein NT139_02825 [Candidatus Woesearchaeota archaeon]|nr:hypothetical protein [Candidatus Woesearchaeota archaeon]
MNIFIKTFKEYKKKFLLFLLADGLFFGLLFYFLIFVKNKLKNYLLVLQSYGSELGTIENLQQKDIVASMKLDTILRTMESITSNALFFIYILIPIVLFLLWWIFQGINFKLVYENKVKKILDLKYFFRFGFISILFFIVFTFIFLGFFNIIYSFFQGESMSLLSYKFLFYLISSLLLGYYFFVVYSLTNKYKIKDLVKKSFKIALKKFYILFPLFLLLSIILFITFIPFSYLFLRQTVLGLSVSYLNYLFWFVPLFLILGFYRMFLCYSIEKYE